MSLNYNFDTSTHDEFLKSEAWKGFLHNYKLFEAADDIVNYSDQDFRQHGIPTPRQYIAWRRIIEMIGEENFSKLPLELVKLDNLEILLVDKFDYLFKSDQVVPDIQGEVTFACGYFWRTLPERRAKMINFIICNILANGWKVNIFTQNKYLKKQIGRHKNLKVKRVRYRIDVHYIIVDNKTHPEKSYIFLELPHSEAFYFRLDTYFPFEKIKEFSNSKKDDFLDFLNDMCKWHPFEKSIPSKRNYAINRK